ncbi:12213_t:CDS:2, partial [Gigaspora rosea]
RNTTGVNRTEKQNILTEKRNRSSSLLDFKKENKTNCGSTKNSKKDTQKKKEANSCKGCTKNSLLDGRELAASTKKPTIEHSAKLL